MSETPSSEGSGPGTESVVPSTSKIRARTSKSSTVATSTLKSKQLDMAKKLEHSNTYNSLCKTRDELSKKKARALELESQLAAVKASLSQLDLAKAKYVSET